MAQKHERIYIAEDLGIVGPHLVVFTIYTIVFYFLHKAGQNIEVFSAEPFISSTIFSFLKTLGGGGWSLILDIGVALSSYFVIDILFTTNGGPRSINWFSFNWVLTGCFLPSGVLSVALFFLLSRHFEKLAYANASGAASSICYGFFWIGLFVPLLLYVLRVVVVYKLHSARSQKQFKAEREKQALKDIKNTINL